MTGFGFYLLNLCTWSYGTLCVSGADAIPGFRLCGGQLQENVATKNSSRGVGAERTLICGREGRPCDRNASRDFGGAPFRGLNRLLGDVYLRDRDGRRESEFAGEDYGLWDAV